jgi:hypothetical protein
MQKKHNIYFNYGSKIFYPSYVRNSYVVAKPSDTDDRNIYKPFGEENTANTYNRLVYGYILNAYLINE